MPDSEVDPLLPKGKGAPEISGYGFSDSGKDSSSIDSQDERYSWAGNNSMTRKNRFKEDFSPLRIILVLVWLVVGLALIAVLFSPGVLNPALGRPHDSDSAPSIGLRVDKILSDVPLIDGHNDFAILIRAVYHNRIYSKSFTTQFEQGDVPFHVDLPRLKAGKAGGAFWSAFTPCPKDGMKFSNDNYAKTVAMTFSQVDLLRRLTAAYPGTFSSPDLNRNNALSAFKQNRTLVSPIGIEGLHQIGNSISNIRLLHALGVKYSTLTHNCHNIFADAALIINSTGTTIAAPPHWGGLSTRGMLLVQEMNRLGMLIDLAHVSTNTMVDVLGGRPGKTKGSLAPVMFSHSSAFALCPHPRNVPDNVLQLVKRTNSIVMVNFAPYFISCVPSGSDTGIPDFYPPNSTLHQVARHVIHVGQTIGYDHVGLGSDFDGIPFTPKGLDDVSKYPDLIAELLRMGVCDEDAKKVVGLNVLRVWGDAERQAQKMQRDGILPLEDDISRMDDG